MCETKQHGSLARAGDRQRRGLEFSASAPPKDDRSGARHLANRIDFAALPVASSMSMGKISRGEQSCPAERQLRLPKKQGQHPDPYLPHVLE